MMAEKLHPKIMLLDFQMPVLDGLGLARWIRENRPDLPVIVASGRLDEAGIAQLRSQGVAHFLPKPFEEERLVETLRRVLRDEELARRKGQLEAEAKALAALEDISRPARPAATAGEMSPGQAMGLPVLSSISGKPSAPTRLSSRESMNAARSSSERSAISLPKG